MTTGAPARCRPTASPATCRPTPSPATSPWSRAAAASAPGTIHPRLQRLEAEGLVTQSQEGGRKVYRIRRQQRHENRRRRDRGDWDWNGAEAATPRLERRLRDLLTGTEQVLRRAHLTEAQVRQCAAILDESFQRTREVLRDTR